MSATQATEVMQIGIGQRVPVTPTRESQADKGIDHPLCSCEYCDTVWRSHEITRCPSCAREVGTYLVLDQEQTDDLMEALSYLDQPAPFDVETETTEREAYEFQCLLETHAPWYRLNCCRMTIQACYEALRARPSHPNVDFAIAFFRAEYEFAEDDEMTFDREIRVIEDKAYDKQHPGW